ncbi:DUF819 family protein [Francisella frigiditurris]|uniref:DUF819 domain-containing protein n=1 Tax=Francisella frigiditurris TaxID=1542390 RepID=A0A1J0KRG2_9GAMM|nr:DUF819 family protein [Francisella frigiditurris]APC96290.1 hypothetical protein KX01_1423 [Francisella frigiditurris]
MISSSLGYISSLLLISSIIVYVAAKSKRRFFEYVPAIVLIYFIIVILSICGLWDTTSTEIQQTKSSLQHTILPVMLFLMLINCDIRIVVKLGRKLLIAFFGASLTIIIGFIVMYILVGKYIALDAWKGFAALSGSWMGGMGNMVAVKQALNTPDTQMSYILLTDSISYTVWFAFLFALISRSKVFDKWVKASDIEDHVNSINFKEKENHINFAGMFILIGVAFTASCISYKLADYLPETTLISTSTWGILIVTVFGFIMAMTPLAKIKGDDILANMFLYSLIALIASGSSFKGFSDAPTYIVCGFIVLAVHGILMLILAKIFRLNLSICSIASLANIGGIGGSTILASAYAKNLISIAIIMSLLGFAIGTEGGLVVAKILSGF